jgi:hypothetical protein
MKWPNENFYQIKIGHEESTARLPVALRLPTTPGIASANSPAWHS